MLITIPTKALPSQSTSTIIANQSITVKLYISRSGKLYADSYLASIPLFKGIRVVQNQYINPYTSMFNGYLFVYNFDSTAEPSWENLGTTCQLMYSDVDVLQFIYDVWELENLTNLQKQYGV